jgi:AcrR family transcriptional regulator
LSSWRLLCEADVSALTIERIAADAGVGKQTIYRWWPSKSAVLVDAVLEQARTDVPVPNTGALQGDLEIFMRATFRGARQPSTKRFLLTVATEAQRNEGTAALLREFTSQRRAHLQDIFRHARDRGELEPEANIDLLVDQAFGVLWYRLLIGHAPLSTSDATALASGLCRQAQPRDTRSASDPS